MIVFPSSPPTFPYRRRLVVNWLAVLLAIVIAVPAMAQREGEKPANESSTQQNAESYYAKAEELAKQEKLLQQRARMQQEQFEQRMREFKEQQSQLEHAMKELERVRRETESSDLRVSPFVSQKVAEMIAARGGEMELAREQAKKRRVPDDAIPRAFVLHRIKAFEVADVLQKIYADAPMRIAVDEPRNLLLVLSDDKTLQPVAQLIEQLDQPAQDSDVKKKAETLQLRVVWIGNARGTSRATFSEPVRDALHELGFSEPRVLYQTMVSTVVGPDQQGEFDFELPVGSSLQLTGGGNIYMADDDRYKINFSIRTHQRVGHDILNDGIEGAVSTPLEHSMIVGTTALALPAEDGTQPEDRHPCALIIQLKRAPEFDAKVLETEQQ